MLFSTLHHFTLKISTHYFRSISIFYGLILAVLTPHSAFAVGLMPVPQIDDVSFSTVTRYNETTGRYTYRYAIENKASNQGEIWYIKVDISQVRKNTARLRSTGLEIPYGSTNVPFNTMLSRMEPLFLPPGATVVPIGQEVPNGWLGGFGRDGFAGFASKSGTPKIGPGSRLDGFAIISHGVPTIRAAQVIPDWVLVIEDHGTVSEEELNEAGRIEGNMVFHTHVLGPANAMFLGSYDHWNQLRDDIDKASELGWFTDAALLETIKSQLINARAELDARDGTAAKIILNELVDTVNLSTLSQLTREAHDLVTLNLQSLIANTTDTPVPIEPLLTLTPPTATRSVGATHTVTAKLVNAANDEPISGVYINFRVVEGPHRNVLGLAETDQAGEAKLTYTGKHIGTDRIALVSMLGALDPNMMVASTGSLSAIGLSGSLSDLGRIGAEATVTWKAGADLAIPFFSPRVLTTAGGNQFFISDITENIGDLTAPQSVTRYFMSNTPSVEPETATMVGERTIEPLEPGESSDSSLIELTIPAGFPPGDYYFAACADAPESIVEHDEENNCSFSEYTTQRSVVVDVLLDTNTPPDCSAALPSTASLWPPNHQLITVRIDGVTDADEDPITIRVDSITQDEPVNDLGDGNFAPDGFGVGDSLAQLRAERSGPGNGRVYEIRFTAEDNNGGSCSGKVQIGVPHDQRKGSEAINDGQHYDSTSDK